MLVSTTFHCRVLLLLIFFMSVNAAEAAGTLSIGAPTLSSCGDITINGVVLPSSGDSISGVSWDWGDGRTSVSWFPAAHSYRRNGSYAVTVTAKSQAGEILTKTVTASVTNAEDALCAYEIRVQPGSLTFRDGQTSATMRVVLLGPSGVPVAVDNSKLLFTSASPSLVSVDGQGIARASGFGQTTLTVRAEGYPRTATVNATVGHLRIEPALLVLQLSGQRTGQLRIDAGNADGTPLDLSKELTTWSGSNDSASVDGDGRVTALGLPSATVDTPQMRATVRGVGSHNSALVRVLNGPQALTVNRITASPSASTVFYLPTQVAGFSPTQLFSTFDAARIIDLAFGLEQDASGISLNNGDLQYLAGDVAMSSAPRPCGYNGNPAVFGSALDSEASCVAENSPHSPAWGIFFHELGHNFTLASQRFSQFALPTWSGTAGPTYTEALATGAGMYAGRALAASAAANNISAPILTSILNSHLVWWHPGQTPSLDAYVAAGASYSKINADIVDDILSKLMDKYGFQMYKRFLSTFVPANERFPFDITSDARQATVFVAALGAAVKADLRESFATWGFPLENAFYNEILPIVQQSIGLSDDSPAAPAITSVSNAASFVAGAVAPGAFVAIQGANLGPQAGLIGAGSQKGLAGSIVTFNGIEAYLTYSSATQINAVVPYGVGSKADVVVQYNGRTSHSFPLAVTASLPGIFTTQYGPGQAWAINDDGHFNSSSAPAVRGKGWIAFWATGQGEVSPAGEDGEVITAPKNLTLPWSVTIGGQTAPPIYALLTYTGEIQIAVSIPEGTPSGDAELILTIGSASSRKSVTVAVK